MRLGCYQLGTIMHSSKLTILLTILTTLPTGTVQGPHEKRLLEDIFNKYNYNSLERPVANESEPLTVSFGLVLQQIIDVDEKMQILTSNIWLNVVWNDYNLRWNESEYPGVKSIRIPPRLMWKPDILMYNSADEDIDSTFPTNIVVTPDGNCLWVPPGLFLSTCKIDITWFPFDDQMCNMKFGSWSYDGSAIDLQLAGEGGDISSFIKNGEWELIGLPAKRNVVQYECCPEQYIDITFTIHIRRRTLYYGFNLIIPCVLISTMAFLTFTLPPDAGEKISLGVTILLSLTVFLLLVAETMPPTSDAVPLIGMYFSCIMLMCSLSVAFTVLVLNYHHRTPDTHEMPNWVVKRGVCEWLAWILRMRRPGTDPEVARRKVLGRNKMRDLELRERSSRSLLANVLDLDDDFRGVVNHQSTTIGNNGGTGNYTTNYMRQPAAPPPPPPPPMNDNHTSQQRNSVKHNNTNTSMTNSMGGGSSFGNGQGQCQSCSDGEFINAQCTGLRDILKELQVLTGKVKKDEQFDEECNDWKFAAMVIDRLCLWLFTMVTTVSTCAILFSAPHLFS